MCPGPPHGIFDQRGARFDLQLFAYVESMSFDGLRSLVQELADLARCQTLAKQTKNFKFTIGELAEGRILRALSAAGKDFRGLFRHLLTEISITTQNLADGLDKFLAPLIFHNIAARTRP